MQKLQLTIYLCISLMVSLSFSGLFGSSFNGVEKGSWVELAKQVVSPGAEYDALVVEKSEESYKQLKFKVLKSSIYIRNLTILYTDGTSESQIITRQFKKGNSSRVFDLAAHGRIIEKIIFTYRSRVSAKVEAELQVYARP